MIKLEHVDSDVIEGCASLPWSEDGPTWEQLDPKPPSSLRSRALNDEGQLMKYVAQLITSHIGHTATRLHIDLLRARNKKFNIWTNIKQPAECCRRTV
jgi:hypothetical protein